jgi:hypothetical protein
VKPRTAALCAEHGLTAEQRFFETSARVLEKSSYQEVRKQ